MRDRIGEYALPGSFTMGNDIKKYIKTSAKKAASSHVQTLSNDLYQAVREAALQGKSRDNIIKVIKEKYNKDIVEKRATTIARTETNRAFSHAQYEADIQFVQQNKLQNRAFKQWVTRSSNPCAFCKALEAEGPIPFTNDFRGLGDSVVVDGKTLTVSYESLQAGNAHPNCSCIYKLVIEPQSNYLERLVTNSEAEVEEIKEKKKSLDDILADLSKLL